MLVVFVFVVVFVIARKKRSRRDLRNSQNISLRENPTKLISTQKQPIAFNWMVTNKDLGKEKLK